MSQAPFVNAQLVETLLDIIRRQNEGRDINIIVACIESNCPPTVVSSIHPDQVPDVLQFLVDNHARAKVEAHMGGESGSIN